MRFHIEINQCLSNDPVLVVYLDTRTDEQIEQESEDGIYNCCATISEDRAQLLGTVAQCVNACIEEYQKHHEG